LKIKEKSANIRPYMVITVSDTTGIKCQVGEFSLLVDSPPQRKGNLILKTHTKLPVDSFSSPEVIFGPGEYEIEGVTIRGIALPENSGPGEIRSAYAVNLDGMNLAFMSDISSEPSENALDALGEVDILFLSVDTKKFKPKQTITLIKQIDPSIIVPADDKTAKFLIEEMGQKVKAEEKLTIKKKDIIKEDVANKLIWLKTK